MSDGEDSPTISATAPTHPILNPLYFVGSRDYLSKLVTQEREKHRQAINESLNALVQLHALQNSLAPVNSLPAELLGLIFSHLVFQGDLQSRPSNSLGYTSQHNSHTGFLIHPPNGHGDIVSVTHVCRYWRAVSIQNPWLWTSLPIHHPGALEVCLARSKNLPISLSLPRRLSSDAAPALASSVHRIRSIYVETTLAVDIELLWGELSRLAPNLEELFIEHTTCNSYLHGYDVGRIKRLPPILNGEAPSLRVLTFRGVPSPFELFPATLAHLDIGQVQGPLPPFVGLLKMLQGCTLLETLNVRGAWDWEEIDDHVLVRNSVALPKLARTYLQLVPPAAHGLFLASLSLPPYCSVSVVSGVEEHGDFKDALSAITPFSEFIPPCFKGFRRLHLIREGTDGRLQAFRTVDALSERPALDIDCRDPWDQSYIDWRGFFFDWPFDASQIETLVVVLGRASLLPQAAEGTDPASHQTFDEWRATFQQLPALKTLRVMGLPKAELEALLDALEMLGSLLRVLVCPWLTTLEIFDAQDMSAVWDDLVDVAYRRVPRIPSGLQESTLRHVELFNYKSCNFRNLELFVGELGVELVVDGENIVVSAPATPSSSSVDLDPWS